MSSLVQLNFIELLKNKRVAVWGAGANLKKKREFVYQYLKPVMCVDNDVKIWGKEILSGIKCSSPEKLSVDKIDVVVITPESGQAINAISKLLNNEYKVYSLNQIWDEFEVELQKEINFGPGDNRIKHFSCDVGSCVCNMNCSYCYLDFIDQNLKYNSEFPHSIPFMIQALSNARLGGRALFNIVGQGETLLKPGFVELVYGLLLEGHFVQITTNGTVTKKIQELLSFPKDMIERIMFGFSLHYEELRKKKLLEVYFNNFNMVRKEGASAYTTFPGADEYVPYIHEIKKLCVDKTGVLPVVSVVRKDSKENDGFPLGSNMCKEDYFKNWEVFESVSHEMRKKSYGKFTKECYAGINSGWINISTGELRTCSPGTRLDNIYVDIKKRIQFLEESHLCSFEYCSLNNQFLSGRINESIQLPTFYEIYNRIDQNGNSTINFKMREATNYCCDY